MALISLIVVLAVVTCLASAIFRRWRLAAITSPFLLLVAIWHVSTSIPPERQAEIEKMFGSGASSIASDIRAFKPTFMDGHLISFHVTQEDYQKLTYGFSSQPLGGRRFFRRGSRPSSWPSYLESLQDFDRRDLHEDVVLSHYDHQTQTAYASYHYATW